MLMQSSSTNWRKHDGLDVEPITSNDDLNKDKTTRKSSGIACCRFDSETRELEILLVRKRYTYNFAAFVFGQYTRKDSRRLNSLFNGMTVQEKIDILSLRFDILWYKIWLEFPDVSIQSKKEFDLSTADAAINTWNLLYKQKASDNFVTRTVKNISQSDFYIKKKNKFDTTFLSDRGKYLKEVIANTKSVELIWEIPKGRKNKNETMIDCAIREFKEETSVDISFYSIMFNIKPIIESYISSNVRYIHNYYTAYTIKDFDPIINFKYDNISEIDSIRWVTLDEIKFIDHSGRLYKIVSRIFNMFNTKYKYIKN